GQHHCACGGPRAGARGGGEVGRSRWWRMARTPSAEVTTAKTLRMPPQGHATRPPRRCAGEGRPSQWRRRPCGAAWEVGGQGRPRGKAEVHWTKKTKAPGAPPGAGGLSQGRRRRRSEQGGGGEEAVGP